MPPTCRTDHGAKCVKTRGKQAAHVTKEDKGSKPAVSLDLQEFGEDGEEDDTMAMIVLNDEETGCLAAHISQQKGATDT